MTKDEKIYLASKYAEKGYDYEQLYYGDDLYNEEDKELIADDIWDYVIEYKEEGFKRFREKYKEYKLY